MENKISLIRSQFSSGQFEVAKKILFDHLKKYAQLTEEEQSFLIGMLINFEEYEKARVLLSKDCDNPTKNSDSEFFLKKLQYYAQIKFHEQSLASGKKLFNKVIQAIKEKKDTISKSTYKTLISQTVSNLRSMYDFQSIIDLAEYYPYTEPCPIDDCLMKVEVLRARTFLANRVSKEDLLEMQDLLKRHPDSSWYQSIIKMHEVELKIFFNFLTEEELKDLEKYVLTSKIPPTHRKHFSHLLGLGNLMHGKQDVAFEHLSMTLENCDSISLTQSIYYWMEQIKPGTLSLADYILTKCAPTLAIESFLSGNRFSASPLLHTPFYQKQLDALQEFSPEDCWFITKHDIQLKIYNNFLADGKCLDLKAGLFFGGKKTIVLTDLRIQLLRLIISFGKKGAHQSYLIDTMFDGTFYYYDSAKLRLKNLIVEINKLGIKIKGKNNCYFFDFDRNNFSIIFPLNHTYSGPIAHLKKIGPLLSRQIIEKHLNVKPSTASLYLKKWKEEGLIFKDQSQKYGEFSFTKRVSGA